MAGSVGREAITWVQNDYQAGDRSFLVQPTHQSLLLHVKASLVKGQKIALGTDKKGEALDIASDLTKAGYKALVVTADNVESELTQAFLTDPTLVIGYDALVYSPSLGTGFDLNFPYFDTQYLLGSHLGATELHQLAYRVRQLSTGEVHCYIKAPRYESPSEVKRGMAEPSSYRRNRQGTLEPLDLALDTRINDLYLYKETARRESCNRLAHNFYLQAIQEGYQVLEAESSEGAKVDLKAYSEARREAEVTAILEASCPLTAPSKNAPKAEREKYWLTRILHLEPDSVNGDDVRAYLRDPKAATRVLDTRTPQALLKADDIRRNDGRLTIDHQQRAETARVLELLTTPILDALKAGVSIDQTWLSKSWGKLLHSPKTKAVLRALKVKVDMAKLGQTLKAVFQTLGLELVSERKRVQARKATSYKEQIQPAQVSTYSLSPESLARLEALIERGLARHTRWLEIQGLTDKKAKGYKSEVEVATPDALTGIEYRAPNYPSFDELYENDWLGIQDQATFQKGYEGAQYWGEGDEIEVACELVLYTPEVKLPSPPALADDDEEVDVVDF